jgi:hypothetical protein
MAKVREFDGINRDQFEVFAGTRDERVQENVAAGEGLTNARFKWIDVFADRATLRFHLFLLTRCNSSECARPRSL